ncbi:ATPase [Halobacillus litoralis]|uniref:ATPase n=1 Tax=Halobacillus litoralis TaxID=45668 RepID=UPI001CD2B832|nr:ATPase [Halobacillus litoralis]MCA0970621.1 ATPase [Halobacillus litoralis]
MLISYFFIPLLVSLGVIMYFSKAYKDKEKKDEGFAYNYFHLSYRRKFIRTLTSSWMGVLAVVIIFIFSPFSTAVNVGIGVFIAITFVAQGIYNYYMWKKEEE